MTSPGRRRKHDKEISESSDDSEDLILKLKADKKLQNRLALELIVVLAAEQINELPDKEPPKDRYIQRGFKWLDYPFFERNFLESMPLFKENVLSPGTKRMEFTEERLPEVLQLAKENGYAFRLPIKDVEYRLRYWYNNKIQLGRQKVWNMLRENKLTSQAQNLLKNILTTENWEHNTPASISPQKRGREDGVDDERYSKKVDFDDGSSIASREKQTTHIRPIAPNNQKAILERLEQIGSNKEYINDTGTITLAKTMQVLLHVKLVSGHIQSAAKQCIDLLITEYRVAADLMTAKQTNETELWQVRERLAQVWCLFAHLTLELGALTKGKTLTTTWTEDTPPHQFREIAMAILSKALACPLTGNHALPQIAFARLYHVSSSLKDWSEDSASELCWNALSKCHLHMPDRPTVKVTLPNSEAIIKCFRSCDIGMIPFKVEIMSKEALSYSLKTALEYPSLLRRHKETPWFVDRQSAAALCTELSRLSGEKTETMDIDTFYHFCVS